MAEYLGDMEIQDLMLSQAQAPLEKTAQLLIGVECLEKVRAFALAKAKQKGLGDSIEVMLYCKLKLKDRLQLPISTKGMRYPSMASISDEELAQAEKDILAKVKTREQWADILVRRDLWKDKIKKEYPKIFDRIDDEYQDALVELEKLPKTTLAEKDNKTSQQIEATSHYEDQVKAFTMELVKPEWITNLLGK